ncbi:uncharacterized protein BDR25DRAFT_300486 [Lindgomyces ingoldianus]|uniref:Uncharacterized protein n=1 Tax=Lindgomyces ingoldianus TaxID=673940 RepID=A0ACB6RCM7_9PLEO|nr:uncharacterized protein BDR25DRAFT_300486 [Lindgomyces ingoldianus]KAF2476513.1 hypothetical protein BDR25DRAFT_300486 [Lindgomyces ingoldianus]
MDASKLLQLQTAAAHSHSIPKPLQQSASSSKSNDSASSKTATPSPPVLCCSRCRRTSTGSSGMVSFGTNLFYCSHCASMVGYNHTG